MSNESLGNSRIALEEAFFARENEALRRRLKDMDESKRKKEALSAASGITDDAVLEKLAGLNIRACRQLSHTMLATSWTAAKKFRAVFSYRVAIARNCLILAKKFSIKWRAA
jgi:hypothetical protein